METAGPIDATEMSDLTLIVHTASLFGSLTYVDNLASKIVLGNTANAHYQGGTLGNLAVGSIGHATGRTGRQVVFGDRSSGRRVGLFRRFPVRCFPMAWPIPISPKVAWVIAA